MNEIQIGKEKETPEDIDRYLTIGELSALLKVPKSWLYRQTRQTGSNSIPRIKVGKYLRFEWRKVLEWLMRQQDQQ